MTQQTLKTAQKRANSVGFFPVSLAAFLLVSSFSFYNARADDASLEAVQAKQAQSLTRFYQNMLQNPGASPSEKNANFNTELSDANAEFAQLANRRQTENENLVFNKAFLPNGSRIDSSKYDPNAELGALMARYPASTADVSQNSGAGPSLGSAADQSTTSSRREAALDGSKIPKVIEFIPRSKQSGGY